MLLCGQKNGSFLISVYVDLNALNFPGFDVIVHWKSLDILVVRFKLLSPQSLATVLLRDIHFFKLNHFTFSLQNSRSAFLLDHLTVNDVRVLVESEDEASRRGGFHKVFPSTTRLALSHHIGCNRLAGLVSRVSATEKDLKKLLKRFWSDKPQIIPTVGFSATVLPQNL